MIFSYCFCLVIMPCWHAFIQYFSDNTKMTSIGQEKKKVHPIFLPHSDIPCPILEFTCMAKWNMCDLYSFFGDKPKYYYIEVFFLLFYALITNLDQSKCNFFTAHCIISLGNLYH